MATLRIIARAEQFPSLGTPTQQAQHGAAQRSGVLESDDEVTPTQGIEADGMYGTSVALLEVSTTQAAAMGIDATRCETKV